MPPPWYKNTLPWWLNPISAKGKFAAKPTDGKYVVSTYTVGRMRPFITSRQPYYGHAAPPLPHRFYPYTHDLIQAGLGGDRLYSMIMNAKGYVQNGGTKNDPDTHGVLSSLKYYSMDNLGNRYKAVRARLKRAKRGGKGGKGAGDADDGVPTIRRRPDAYQLERISERNAGQQGQRGQQAPQGQQQQRQQQQQQQQQQPPSLFDRVSGRSRGTAAGPAAAAAAANMRYRQAGSGSMPAAGGGVFAPPPMLRAVAIGGQAAMPMQPAAMAPMTMMMVSPQQRGAQPMMMQQPQPQFMYRPQPMQQMAPMQRMQQMPQMQQPAQVVMMMAPQVAYAPPAAVAQPMSFLETGSGAGSRASSRAGSRAGWWSIWHKPKHHHSHGGGHRNHNHHHHNLEAQQAKYREQIPYDPQMKARIYPIWDPIWQQPGMEPAFQFPAAKSVFWTYPGAPFDAIKRDRATQVGVAPKPKQESEADRRPFARDEDDDMTY